jgi:MFS family permease
MSGEAAGERSSAEAAASGRLGVLATWRQTPRQAKALLAGVFVNRLAGFLQVFLALYLTHRGYSPGQAGLALGVYAAGGILGTFAGGSLSDRLSARTATLISMLGSAVLIASIIYIGVYLLILLAVLLVSTVGQLYRPAAQSLITELAPPGQLVMVTAMYRLCLNLGTSVAPVIGVALVSVSYDLLFWGEALAALIYGLIALVALPRRADPAEATPAAATEPRPGYRALLADRRYLVFLGGFFLVCIVYCQYTAVLPLAIVRSGLSIWWYGAIVALNAVVVVTCEVAATKFVQSWPMRLAQLSGWSLLAIGYGIYAIALVPVFLILGTLLWTLSEIIAAPTTYAYPGLVAPARLRARYFGAMQSMFGLGFTLGPILGVELFNHVGQRWVWLWVAAVGVLATIVGRFGIRPSPAADSRSPVSRSSRRHPALRIAAGAGGVTSQEWQRLITLIAEFEPDSHTDFLDRTRQEVIGMAGYAEAWIEAYKTMTGPGLAADPLALRGLHRFADAAAAAAEHMAAAREEFAAYYRELRESAAAGKFASQDGRRLTGEIWPAPRRRAVLVTWGGQATRCACLRRTRRDFPRRVRCDR